MLKSYITHLSLLIGLLEKKYPYPWLGSLFLFETDLVLFFVMCLSMPCVSDLRLRIAYTGRPDFLSLRHFLGERESVGKDTICVGQEHGRKSISVSGLWLHIDKWQLKGKQFKSYCFQKVQLGVPIYSVP